MRAAFYLFISNFFASRVPNCLHDLTRSANRHSHICGTVEGRNGHIDQGRGIGGIRAAADWYKSEAKRS